ncbi:MAG: hypothetical protein IKV16_01655, partial [Clostridia bacterium]|nr:hypothetical protein [Clostridia bacterium]
MLYDSYRSKMLRRRSRIEFFKRHFWKFLILFIFIAALISSVIMLKGTVLFANFQKTLEYGEKCEPSVSAFLSSCNIEFKHSDGTWREVQPSMPGRYAIRCYGTGIDGQRRYSQEEGFEITKREIKVSVAEDSVIYGEELTLAADVAYGDTVICNGFSYSDIDSASDEEKIMRVTPQLAFIKVLNEEGKNIAAIAYKIATEEKEVKILPREITIKVFGDTKEYDGTSLSSDKYEIVKGSVLPTDELRLIFDKSITDVDRIENTPADETITDHRSRDVKGLYKITYDIGYLEITPKIIYVDTGSLSIPYDGKSHFSKEYSLLSEVEDFFHGDKIELKSYPEFKYAGEYDNKLEFIVTDKNKRDVTNNYNVIIRNCGKIEIRKIPVLVTTASKRWDYDGKAHTLSDFDIIGLINGAKPEANAATFTYVTDATPGVKNKFSINIYDEEGAKVNSCYAIDYSYGILAVDKREISVKPSDVSFIYNGAAQTATGYDMTDGELAADQRLHSSTLTPKLAGSYTFKFSDGEVRILDKNNNDVTSNYDIIFETGIVTIEPRPIIIAMKYATREYDGTPLTSTAHEVKPAGGFDFALVSGHFVDSVTANGSQLIPGKSDNELVDCVIRDPGGNDMTANYRVDTTVAYLEITPRKITLETHSAKKIYDGAPLECAKAPVLYSGSLGKDHYLDMTECGAIS